MPEASTGLDGTIKEFVMNVVSVQLGEGVHDVAKVEIARDIIQAGGSVSRTGLKSALAELSERNLPVSARASAGVARPVRPGNLRNVKETLSRSDTQWRQV